LAFPGSIPGAIPGALGADGASWTSTAGVSAEDGFGEEARFASLTPPPSLQKYFTAASP
jgi:hypothetical protein